MQHCPVTTARRTLIFRFRICAPGAAGRDQLADSATFMSLTT
jgi:hypothetical protein